PVSLPQGLTYYLLNKPEGIMTTARDPEGRSTVLELVPARPRVFPVGRLDRDTSGALLLTDDGPLAHRILHPRYGLEKEYLVVIEGPIGDDAVSALREGVLLEGERRPTAPAEVEVLERKARRSRIRIVIHEGRNRQVRRMFEAMGHIVLQLRRQRIGPVALGDLEEGLFRPLTEVELAALRRATGRPRPRPPRPSSRGDSTHARRRPRPSPDE
ncbi:MAG TPA: pseudouridine synthase, partial [Candidatus Eisenbacteria bacterium]|nr:pseudouridine synthase [Candidatus Eisenbacteria bacterium]